MPTPTPIPIATRADPAPDPELEPTYGAGAGGNDGEPISMSAEVRGKDGGGISSEDRGGWAEGAVEG